MPRSVVSLTQRPRTGGSGYTVFQWQGSVIAWARNIRTVSPQPVAAPVAIQPLDSRYPIQIMTPAALGPGTLEVSYFEKFNEKIWDEIMEKISNNTTQKFNDLVQVFIQLASQNNPVTCMKIVNPPTLRGQAGRTYADLYHNCVITNVNDGENIEIGSMEIVKQLTIMYTYMTRHGDGYGSSSNPDNLDLSGLAPSGLTDTLFS